MTGAELTLRDATNGDAAVVAELLGELGYPADPRDMPSRIEAVRREGGEVFVAVDATGEVLGLMCLSRHVALHTPLPIGYIDALVTSGSARRRGVGRFLVEQAKAWAKRSGCGRLTLTSAEHREAAHAFYPSCGMPYTGRRFATQIVP
ncbi:MAG TPA: GNAT family N-acetyltransferase [Gemmatimonadaceae bacterium]